ncbi:hypothetical protein [Saccharopolyspora cebuensis]|uniref:Uncharacterized protein n=1 Tax=Saccharopolyspora cebuensis TaxID=418759 RepID=A0ABV4CL22_9PSEU
MRAADRLVLGFLLLDAFLLALIELLFLPSYLGPVQFPITAAVAAVTTPLLVAEAGRLAPHRGVASAPLLVWFATVFAVGMFGPGGDIVLPGNDWRTLLLIVGGALPGAMMLGIVLARRARG